MKNFKFLFSLLCQQPSLKTPLSRQIKKKFRLLAYLAVVGAIATVGYFSWHQYQNSSVSSNTDAAIGETEVIDLSNKICTEGKDINKGLGHLPNHLNVTLFFKCSFSNGIGKIGIVNTNNNKLAEITIGDNSYLFIPYSLSLIDPILALMNPFLDRLSYLLNISSPSLTEQLTYMVKARQSTFLPIRIETDKVIKLKVLPVRNITKKISINTYLNVGCNEYVKTVWSVDIIKYCLSENTTGLNFTNWSEMKFKLNINQDKSVVLDNKVKGNTLPSRNYVNYTKSGIKFITINTITDDLKSDNKW